MVGWELAVTERAGEESRAATRALGFTAVERQGRGRGGGAGSALRRMRRKGSMAKEVAMEEACGKEERSGEGDRHQVEDGPIVQ